MEEVEGKVDLIAVVGGGEETGGVVGDHVELGARGLANDADDGVVTSGAEFKSAASGEVEGELAELAKLGRKGL